MAKKTEIERTNFRFNILTTLIYIAGILLIIQLFNLQIIHGKEYRETSNVRLSKEVTVEAARGKILDRTGKILADTQIGFNVDLYKTKAKEEDIKSALLILAQILEKNGDKYIDEFPISVEPFQYNFDSDEELNKWRDEFDISEKATPEEAFYKIKDNYNIEGDDIRNLRKEVGLRYTIETIGYTSTTPIQIAQNISRASMLEISERGNELPGINIEVESNRVYSQGALASHIIGYIGRINEEEYNKNKGKYEADDYIGKTGIESLFEEYLKGENGIKQIDMTVDGASSGEYTTKEAIGGSNIVLTIDANLQNITEQALENNINKIKSGQFGQVYDAQGGAAVVLNVKTGEILAMASFPDYEPGQFLNGISNEKWNEYQNNSAILNRAIQGTYAPGSIFKMATAIAGLESGAITIDEYINDTGVYPRAHHPECWIYTSYHYGHGYLNVSGAIQHSCNYFFYETAERMGIDKLSAYASYFGLGRRTGVELPNESSGTLASVETAQKKGEEWTEGGTLSAAIGQSYNDFTPLQVAKYIAMVANKGQVVKPTIIQNVVNSEGNQVPKESIQAYVNQKLGLDDNYTESINMSEENINAVLEGMRSVTDEVGGTAYDTFKDFNISVGGKTGSTEAGNYTNAWFAGFAPFDNPEIAVVVLVENGGHGSYTAEVVRDIIGEYFGMNVQEIREDMSATYDTESLR